MNLDFSQSGLDYGQGRSRLRTRLVSITGRAGLDYGQGWSRLRAGPISISSRSECNFLSAKESATRGSRTEVKAKAIGTYFGNNHFNVEMILNCPEIVGYSSSKKSKPPAPKDRYAMVNCHIIDITSRFSNKWKL